MVKATAVYVPNSLMPPFPHALLPSEEHFPPACAAGAPVRTSDPTLRVPLCVAPRVLLLTRDLYLLHPRPSPSSFPPIATSLQQSGSSIGGGWRKEVGEGSCRVAGVRRIEPEAREGLARQLPQDLLAAARAARVALPERRSAERDEAEDDRGWGRHRSGARQDVVHEPAYQTAKEQRPEEGGFLLCGGGDLRRDCSTHRWRAIGSF